MKIELLNDMYLELQKGGGYNLYKRYTTAKGEPRKKRIAYAGDLNHAVKAFLQALQYEEQKGLHTLFTDYVKRVEQSNQETVNKITSMIDRQILNVAERGMEALKKESPMQPSVFNDSSTGDSWVCENCKKTYSTTTERYDYCPSCGQRILWRDINDN